MSRSAALPTATTLCFFSATNSSLPTPASATRTGVRGDFKVGFRLVRLFERPGLVAQGVLPDSAFGDRRKLNRERPLKTGIPPPPPPPPPPPGVLVAGPLPDPAPCVAKPAPARTFNPAARPIQRLPARAW